MTILYGVPSPFTQSEAGFQPIADTDKVRSEVQLLNVTGELGQTIRCAPSWELAFEGHKGLDSYFFLE